MPGATALSRTVDNGSQQSSAAELLPTAFAGASGTKLRAAGLYRHGLQGLTLMRALRRALAAACLIVSVMAGGDAMAASGDLLDAIEYYYQKLDHYFVTADAHEISALDAGSFPAGSAPA